VNVTEQLYAKDVTLHYRDLELGAVDEGEEMQGLVDMWGRHVDALAAVALSASFATNTVPNGNGSTCYFFAQTGSGHIRKDASEQVNADTNALNANTLSAAKAAIWAWTDNRSEPLSLQGVPLCLVVPPALGDLALSLTAAGPTDIYTTQLGGTAGATRVSLNVNAGVSVVVNPFLSDTTNWYLIPIGMYSPFVAWVEAPKFDINESDKRFKKLQATYQAKFYPTPPTFTTAWGALVA
jgi:hypothetical protein